jgi:hypothetical protein
MATLTGFETAFKISQIRAISVELAAISALTADLRVSQFARIAQNHAVRVSEFVRTLFGLVWPLGEPEIQAAVAYLENVARYTLSFP